MSLKHIITNTEKKELNSLKWFKQLLVVSLFMIAEREEVMKQMRLTMSYYDVIETESTVSGYWDQTAPKVTRKRSYVCDGS